MPTPKKPKTRSNINFEGILWPQVMDKAVDICPAPGCGSRDVPVYKTTRETSQIIHRLHKCKKCNLKFKTQEVLPD